MKIIEATNVNNAVAKAIPYLLSEGIRETSRNGDVLVAPGPVITIYKNPVQRVLFSPTRDANPFFHLMESLWMLAGRNDLAFPLHFNSRFGSYSDDGSSIWGAYGHRWSRWFGYDQISSIIAELREHPDSRRAVLQIWDGYQDLKKATAGKGRDVPCNTCVYFDCRYGALNMTVSNRSNDALWGAFGANAVHFSVLQEYIASYLGIPVGEYRQFSNNLHIYTDVFSTSKLEAIACEGETTDLYDQGLEPFPLMGNPDRWEDELEKFMCGVRDPSEYIELFFSDVVLPMNAAWNQRKAKLGNGAVAASQIRAKDWQVACLSWIGRREERLV